MRRFLSAAALVAVMVASAGAQDEKDKSKGWFTLPEYGLIEKEKSFELTADKYSVRSKRLWKTGEKCKVAARSVVQKTKDLKDGYVEVRLYNGFQPDGYCTLLWPLKMKSGEWWQAYEAYNSASWKDIFLGKKDDTKKK